MDMVTETLEADRRERELFYLTERLDALLLYCEDEAAAPFIAASFTDVGVSQEGISGILSRIIDFIYDGLEKLVELFITLWEKIIALVDRIWSKVKREKKATESAKGRPEQHEVKVPGDDESVVGDVRDLEDRVEVLEQYSDAMEKADRTVEDHVEEAKAIVQELDRDLEGMSEEAIKKLQEARRSYALKGADSKLVKKAPVISITRLDTGGQRTIKLLMELGKDGLYSQTDTDKDGTVVSHRLYKAPLPDDKVAKRPTRYKAAQSRDLKGVVSQYEKLLKSIDAVRKRKVGKDLNDYRKLINNLVQRIKGAVSKGELTDEVANALLIELNRLNAIMAQLGGPSRVLTEAQLREINEGVNIVKALRENLK